MPDEVLHYLTDLFSREKYKEHIQPSGMTEQDLTSFISACEEHTSQLSCDIARSFKKEEEEKHSQETQSTVKEASSLLISACQKTL